MFSHYIKTAWKVLQRRKVFTFISLFGIAITLTVLLVISTILDNYLYPRGPEQTNNHFLSVSRLTIESKDGKDQWSSRPGFQFLTDNVLRLKSAEIISIFSEYLDGASYLSGDKINNHLKRTDANYWDILKFDFIEGRHFTQQEFDSGQMLAVISDTTRREFFAESKAEGKSIVVNDQKFQVIGVVRDVSFFENIAYADIWVPYTTSPSTTYMQGLTSGWEAMLYHSNPDRLKEIQSEFINLLQQDFISPDPEKYHFAFSGADTPLEKLARNLMNSKKYDGGVSGLLSLFITLAICFMLLPSINLINLNVSRIMERASEIGVRKAFGASSKQLTIQFVIENILITAMGGVIGLIISWLILAQVEASQLIPGANFYFSLNTYLYGFSMVFIFGLISGTYPAFKMSKLNPVIALKGGH